MTEYKVGNMTKIRERLGGYLFRRAKCCVKCSGKCDGVIRKNEKR